MLENCLFVIVAISGIACVVGFHEKKWKLGYYAAWVTAASEIAIAILRYISGDGFSQSGTYVALGIVWVCMASMARNRMSK